jgi:two-component system heavy metal sensor histidine kinase CusS
MRRGSIRIQLTAWFVAVLAVTSLAMIGASWWLSSASVIRATDTSLHARIDGVRRYLEDPSTILTTATLRDEFREYAELTRGEALLGVVDASGVVLCQPAVAGWAGLEAIPASAGPDAVAKPVDGRLGGAPFRVATTWIEARGRRYRVTVAAPMAAADAAIQRFHSLLILLGPLALIVAGAGGYWISRRALAPVDRITQAVQAISVEHLDRRLELPPARDELRRLASTFNEMLARLQAAVGEMTRFTADASHELRTPVALVRTTAELALRHERAPHEYRRALEDVLGYSERMSALVEDLLVLARADAGIESTEPRAVDVVEVVQAASRECAAAARSWSGQLHVDACGEHCTVRGDRRALHRLLCILIDNAVKYGAPHGDVWVQIREAERIDPPGRAVEVIVTDSGIGLDPDDAPRLYERFYRGARARQQVPDGSGLGLAIARTIVERHHGTIRLSAAIDEGRRGCRAEVTLPLVDAEIATDPSVRPGSPSLAAVAGSAGTA